MTQGFGHFIPPFHSTRDTDRMFNEINIGAGPQADTACQTVPHSKGENWLSQKGNWRNMEELMEPQYCEELWTFTEPYPIYFSWY